MTDTVRVQVLTAIAKGDDGTTLTHTLAYPSRGRRPLALAMTAILMSAPAGVWTFAVDAPVDMPTEMFHQMRREFGKQLPGVTASASLDADLAKL